MVLAPFKLQIDKHTIFQQIFTSNQCLKKIILKRVDVVISHQNLAHQRGYNTLLLGHWYEIMALYYVKSILCFYTNGNLGEDCPLELPPLPRSRRPSQGKGGPLDNP